MMSAVEECPVCNESMGVGTSLRTTRPYKCSHAFCAPCARKWGWRGNTCPLCRADRYVSRLRRRACCALNVYCNVSALLFLLHICVMLTGMTVTITYAPDARFKDITLECSSFKACVESHASFVFQGNIK